MAWKSSSYSTSSIDYSRNQAPYAAPQPSHTSERCIDRAAHQRSVNHATPHSGAPWNFCPSCCTAYEKDARFCHECGLDIGKVKLVSDLVPTKCACGCALKKEYKFCPACKAAVDKTWKNIPACTCGAILQIEANACASCGKKTNIRSGKQKTT